MRSLIFFFRPPFLDSNFLENLKLIKEKKIYKKSHVIIHRDKKEDNFENLIKILKKKHMADQNYFWDI